MEVIFKSSPFGTQSHGYEANNSFLLYAFGERLFIRSGRRDIYGSDHHKNWMWHTKSVNCITVNGKSQGRRTATAVGKITEFQTSRIFDYVSGEAAEAYEEGTVDRFTRRILFIKPEIALIYDILKTPNPSSFEWRLHAPVEMEIHDQNDIRIINGGAACKANFLWPKELRISQTDKFDPPPRPRIKLVEYHLTAETPELEKSVSFITVLRPHRAGDSLRGEAELIPLDGGFAVNIPHDKGRVTVLLQQDAGSTLTWETLSTKDAISAALFDEDGNVLETFSLNNDS